MARAARPSEVAEDGTKVADRVDNAKHEATSRTHGDVLSVLVPEIEK
jgi:hypothetical protein